MGINRCRWVFIGLGLFQTIFWGCSPQASSPILDRLNFGQASSEKEHAFRGEGSEVTEGGLGLSARKLPAADPASWKGGSMSFRMKVDPVKANYATVKLWGSEVNTNRLVLYVEGKQVGYLHLGDVELLDIGSDEPGFMGRFYYRTTPLPLALTKGKTELSMEIRSFGPIWPYGAEFDRYQKPMIGPSRGLYSFYTHSDGCFVPAKDERQGEAPAPGLRTGPGSEILEPLKQRVNKELADFIKSPFPNQMQMQFMARAYRVKWTVAYQNPEVLQSLIRGGDKLYADFKKDPKVGEAGPASYNPEWFGLGPVGDVVRLLGKELAPRWNEKISGQQTRSQAWTEMLVYSRDWHRKHRRLYTNQTIINDMYGIYLCNRGVAILDPSKAEPEAAMLRYLYESVGLQPWQGSDEGGTAPMETGGKPWPVAKDYIELTKAGLTKELGYVGNYGEVLDWVTTLYDATRPAPDAAGDPKIKAQLEKMIHARAVFRYPLDDADGFRAMRLESSIGWRDLHYPGDVTYGERATWDASTLYSAANTLDPAAVGYVQQLLADNQFFKSVEHQMSISGIRATAGLLDVPDQYDLLKAQAPVSARLPMTPGQPDFVFTDEEDGVVALKNGKDILYVSLYWRAREAINFLARVHYITPSFDRIAVVRQETQFEPSGLTYTRPDFIDFGFGNGGHHYPEELHSAQAGEILPVARIPEGINFHPGDESVYAGKGDFYVLRYGPYFMGMNLSDSKSFEIKLPPDMGPAKELISGRSGISSGTVETIGPRSTRVFYAGEK